MFIILVTMSSVLFNPGFALSSHFDSDGAPLSQLSWSSSLAVVAISLSGIFSFLFVMLACLCCKKRHSGFKEFKNADGEEYQVDMSPGFHADTEVYFLPLTDVSLPQSKQPSRSVHLQQPNDVGRNSLLYLKEIGHGWFGKVLLGEVNVGLSTNQVVVKELNACASVQEQMHFLEEAQPYRTLQHPALLQCLAQRTEVTPYLLVMEFCPLGDVKGYLRSCRATEAVTPEPLVLQRMACDIASGLLHLHKHHFTHSDLALRNCLLTADVSVKIGDYGLSHRNYKDDYYVTSEQVHVPLRWIAPELVDEVHGNLLVAGQTQQSNIWSLGVTMWELFELGNQPYRHYSDRQVLNYTIREQQLKLAKPLLKVPLAERWYEVMQFCWLQPDQRPTAEEVHLLLSYLCAKGASEVEEDFERRWNSMCPNTGHGNDHGARIMPSDHNPPSSSSVSSSFPLLEQFSGAGDGYHSENGDDILTVTETSHGLNFEYKWEQARAEEHYHAPAQSATLGQVTHRCQDEFYPPGGIVGGCPMEGLGISPSYYRSKQHQASGVVPVFSAHSPSLSSEYYIRIEEPVDCNIQLDYTMCSYSPDYQGSSGSFLTGSAESGECMACPSQANNMGSYWSADIHKADLYDSQDSSPAISLTMEPLLGQVADSSPLTSWVSGHYVSYKDRDGGYYYEPSPPLGMDHHYLIGLDDPPVEPLQESWGSRSLRQALGELENPLRITPSFNTSPQQAYRDPYLDSSQSSIIGKTVTGGYYDMMGSLRKTMPSHTGHTRHGSHSVSINMETGGAVFISHRESDTEEEEEDVFLERHTCNTWPAKHGHGVSSRHRRASHSCRQDSYVDFHYTMPSTDIEDSWPEEHSMAYHSLHKPTDYLEPRQVKDNSACLSLSQHHTDAPSDNAYVYLCHEGGTQVPVPGECCHTHFVDPLTGLLVRNYDNDDYVCDKFIEFPNNEELVNLSPAPGGPIVTKNASIKTDTPSMKNQEQYVDLSVSDTLGQTEITPDQVEHEAEVCMPTRAKSELQLAENELVLVALTEPDSEPSQTVDSGVERCDSSVSLIDILDCSDDDDGNDTTDDITDVTSGIFADESSELTASPAFKSLQKQMGTPDSIDSGELLSVAGSCEGFSLADSKPTGFSKAMDSGYDTENNESPEFVPKEPQDPCDQSEAKPLLDPSMEEEEELEVMAEAEPPVCHDLSQTGDHTLIPLSQKIPYRDSAYFSDYENERLSRDEGEEPLETGEEKVKEEETLIERMDENKRDEEKEEELDNSMALPKEKQEVQLEINLEATEVTEPLCIEEGSLTEEAELALRSPDSELTELEEWQSQEESSSLGDWAAEVVGAMEEVLGTLNGERIKAKEQEAMGWNALDEEALDEALDEAEEEETQISPAGNSRESFYTLPKDKVALQHATNSRRFSSSSPPPPSPSPPPLVSPAEGEEADEEDGDSDDSEESDEELRAYSLQEQSGSEESEEEFYPVPIVVSDNTDTYNLRSLLKVPTLVTAESVDEVLLHGKKVVSFFDDVTVYLFDQESPTKELAEGQNAQSKPQERIQALSDDSSDGNISEESAGFEWEDDFPLLPLPTSKMVCDSPPPRPASTAPEPQPTVKYSRFTVSPSSVSRFSITHVSDSDVESA